MRFAKWETRESKITNIALGHAKRFRAREDGAMTIFAMFLIIGMLIAAGLGVDLMLYEAQRTRLQATLDRAILAAAHPEHKGASSDEKSYRRAVVLSYFETAGLKEFIKAEDIKVVANSVSSEVSATAKMKVDPLLLQFIGMDGFEAVASGTAAQAVKYLEVSLVVDVSGSMRQTSTTGNSKLAELKSAAVKFSNQLLCNPTDTSTSTNCTYDAKNTSLSLVPYASSVTVGKELLTKFTRIDAQEDSYCASFSEADYGVLGIDASKAIRQDAKYYPFGFGSTPGYRYINPNGWNEPSGASAEWHETYWSCFTAKWREVSALEDSPVEMKKRLVGVDADADDNGLDGLGGTAIHTGMKWGAALLQHDIKPAIDKMITAEKIYTGFTGRPFDPAFQTSSKVIVLMTDGLNSDNFRLSDGYRTGPSPFWLNTSDSSIVDGELVTNDSRVMSIYNPNTRMYHWRNAPSGAPSTADHAYGQGSYRKCDWVQDRWGRWSQDCRQVSEPGTAFQLDYKDYWKAGFTLRLFKDYRFLGDPGVFLPNSRRYNRNGAEVIPYDFDGNMLSWDKDGDTIGNVDELLLKQCDAAKQANITIYTIELETSGGSSGGSVLKKCASGTEGDGYYFKVNGSGLATAFETIGQDILRLRLTQ